MVTIPPSSLDIARMYWDGVRTLQADRRSVEATKLGILRAGNSGVVDPATGIASASCVRQAYLRSEGIEIEAADDKQIMFASGLSNEDDWISKLASGGWHGKILKEEEIPINWQTDTGYAVSGRPDIVLCGTDNTPKTVLELKSIQSFWTVRGVVLENKPRISHLAQACHYMWQLGVPGFLIYTNMTNRMIPWKYKDAFKGTRIVDNPEDPMTVIPFHYVYKLDIADGVLYYTNERGERSATIITVDGIKAFYEAVGTMAQTKSIPPRPDARDATGGKAYAPCKYCEFSRVCDVYEDTSFENWFDHAVLRSKGHEV